MLKSLGIIDDDWRHSINHLKDKFSSNFRLYHRFCLLANQRKLEQTNYDSEEAADSVTSGVGFLLVSVPNLSFNEKTTDEESVSIQRVDWKVHKTRSGRSQSVTFDTCVPRTLQILGVVCYLSFFLPESNNDTDRWHRLLSIASALTVGQHAFSWVTANSKRVSIGTQRDQWCWAKDAKRDRPTSESSDNDAGDDCAQRNRNISSFFSGTSLESLCLAANLSWELSVFDLVEPSTLLVENRGQVLFFDPSAEAKGKWWQKARVKVCEDPRTETNTDEYPHS